jgi:hypothetical protein
MGAAPTSTKNNPVIYSNTWKTKKDIVLPLRGTKVQSQAYGVYNPECQSCNTNGCSAGDCSVFTNWDSCTSGGSALVMNANGDYYNPDGNDYQEYTTSCATTCPSKPYCTRPNITECALGAAPGDEEPTYRVDWTPGGLKKITCQYDFDKIKTVEQVYKYIELFNPDPNESEFYRLMNKFCSANSANCIIDPTTKNQITTCSKVTSTGTDPFSSVCKKWFNGLSNQNRDSFISNLCTGSKNAECKCQNRANDPIFTSLKDLLSTAVQDACVYVPCKGSPAFLLNSTDLRPKCPEQLCQNIYTVSNVAGNVTIQNNQNYLACQYNSGGDHSVGPIKPKPTMPPKPVIPPTPVIPVPINQGLDKAWIIYGIVVLICIIFLILYNR